jgi:hypothetical protein
MDNERFAGLLRVLGSGATRRGALGVLAGLAGLGLSEGAAEKGARSLSATTSRTRIPMS